MFLILAGLAGLLVALFIHWLTWTMRQKYPSATLILGSLSVLGLIGFCLLFLTSDIANMVMVALGILWVLALLLGMFQASALKTPWWKGMIGVFLEMGLAFIIGAAFNLTLQRYIPWFEENFPGIDVYAIINAFLWTMIITLLVLAVLRPLIVLRRTAA